MCAQGEDFVARDWDVVVTHGSLPYSIHPFGKSAFEDPVLRL